MYDSTTWSTTEFPSLGKTLLLGATPEVVTHQHQNHQTEHMFCVRVFFSTGQHVKRNGDSRQKVSRISLGTRLRPSQDSWTALVRVVTD